MYRLYTVSCTVGMEGSYRMDLSTSVLIVNLLKPVLIWRINKELMAQLISQSAENELTLYKLQKLADV